MPVTWKVDWVPGDRLLGQGEVDRLCVVWKRLGKRDITLSPGALRQKIGGSHIVLARLEHGGEIIGTATLCVHGRIGGDTGWIEDVVVGEVYDGEGIGTALTQCLLQKASELGLRDVGLTSAAHRESARAVYRKVGMEEKETGVFVKRLA